MATQPQAPATPGRENMGSDLSTGLVQRVVDGIRYAVSGVGPMNFFGPAQPIQPIAQDRAEGRAFDYPVAVNLRMQPREGETGFATLRALADGYDLLRLVIETRKDQIESFDWEIVPRDQEKSADTMKDDIRAVSDFLQSPDQEHDWSQWLRMQIEDLLVIDAMTVYPRKNKGGKLYGFELVDPATIKRVIDDTGRTPLPPDVAYQQILKGIPAVDYSRDALIYTMRNPRTNRMYGFSPVEQVMMTVNIAVRRQLSQLDFYTQGNIPEAIAQVPENWSAKQIQEFQIWWDALLEGNSSSKRKMRFIPSLENIVFPKQEVLKDEYDEWLARIVCFAFSISPSALIKQVNRASGEQMADTAKEEGLMPLLKFFESHMTRMIAKHMEKPELCFKFKVQNKIDPKSQMETHTGYIAAQVMTPDEVREDLGMDAMPEEDRAAAFPAPPPGPGFSPDGVPLAPHQIGKDGKPIPGQTPEEAAKTQAAAAIAAAKAKGGKEPSAAEKMLATALQMLDPVAIDKLAKSLAPQIVHVAGPEVLVEVGDTNVHVPVARPDPGLAKRAEQLEKRDNEVLSELREIVKTSNGNMEKMASAMVALAERPDPVFEVPDLVLNITNEAQQAPVFKFEPNVVIPPTVVNMGAPVVHPSFTIDVHMPKPGTVVEEIERHGGQPERGDIVRIVKRPVE